MSLYVHRPLMFTDPTVAPPMGDDTFYALSPVPHLGHVDPVDWQADGGDATGKKRAGRAGRSALPGLRPASDGFRMVFTPETFRDRYLAPTGTGFSIEPRIFQSAWFRPHNVSGRGPGLYLVGAGTHPGAGLPGCDFQRRGAGKLVPDAPAAMRGACAQND